MSEGRALVYPQALAFGARPLEVPGGRNVLCASLTYPFRLSSGEPIKPADWYEAVSNHGGPMAVPDSMAPLPGAEVVMLGTLPPPKGESREATLRCGQVFRKFLIYQDPEAPNAPIWPGPDVAAWHEEDNPIGRGGPEDERIPLIVDSENPEKPFWLSPTPFDHATRLRRVGKPDESSGIGWPGDAQETALHEAHESLWLRSLHAGDPITLTGLNGEDDDIEYTIPSYRVAMASARLPAGNWVQETARIHCVVLIPSADTGAIIWRSNIGLKDDVLGESVGALVAALEDLSAPKRDEQDLAEIAVERWLDPIRAMDDKPLLPADMEELGASPLGPPPEDNTISARRDAAEDWMREEMGLDDSVKPAVPAAVGALGDKVTDMATSEDVPDIAAIGDIAEEALAASKRRHEEAGFEPKDLEAERDPVVRAERLDIEIDERLARPYRAPHEVSIANSISSHASEYLDAEETLGKIADARLKNVKPPLFWPALEEGEATQFGDKVMERLETTNFERHIDISGAAMVGAAPGAAAATGNADDAEKAVISGRHMDGLLAEETIWRGVEFENCLVTGSSFAGGRIEGCEFRDCVFEGINLSQTTLEDSRFERCEFRGVDATEPVWVNCEFEQCALSKFIINDMALRDVTFTGGSWEEVQLNNGLLVDLALKGTTMKEVTFALVHAPHTRFEELSMFKVWTMAKGFPGGVFDGVDAKTCGFLSTCHFDEVRFERTRFVETGFTNAVFKDATFSPGCRFDACDLSGAVFENTELPDIRFLGCSMATSLWANTNARGAWFLGSILRGVDFTDTKLEGAVFTDADIEGAVFDEDRTIGADFRGTARSTSS